MLIAKYALGTELKNNITGFTGIAIEIVMYITGCAKYNIQPKGKENEHPDAKWLLEPSLERLDPEKNYKSFEQVSKVARLGEKAKDKITGVKGVITGYCESLHTCPSYCIEYKTFRGIVKSIWLDEGRVQVIGKNRITLKIIIIEKRVGCGNSTPNHSSK